MKRLACRATLALAGVVLFGAVGSGADDFVVMEDDVRHPGKVTRDDAKGVALRLRGGGQAEFDRDKVKEVIYDDEKPVEYKIGVESFKNDRYEAALESLDAAMESKHHELLEQYILYYTGLCSRKLGKLDKAVEAFGKLKAQGAKTRFWNEAVGNLVELELERDNPQAAQKHVKGLRGLDRQQLKLLNAQIAEKLKEYAQAARLYKEVAEAGNARLAGQAILGGARCSIAQERYEDAVRQLRDFVKRDRSPTMSAQAYVLLGDALKAQAKAPDGWEKAMLAYMRVPCLYEGDEATEAKALYEASRCFRQMNAEKSADRAARLLGELKRRYPGSKWAKMVQ
ncbi:MAG: tetratricopeptide repeat protein [Planctomycetota bacterium]